MWRSGHTPRCCSSPSNLFETVSSLLSHGQASRPQDFQEFSCLHLSLCYRCTGTVDGPYLIRLFTWVLGAQIQVLGLVWQLLYPLNPLSSPKLVFKSIRMKTQEKLRITSRSKQASREYFMFDLTNLQKKKKHELIITHRKTKQQQQNPTHTQPTKPTSMVFCSMKIRHSLSPNSRYSIKIDTHTHTYTYMYTHTIKRKM